MYLSDVGTIALIGAMVMAVWSGCAAVIGARTNHPHIAQSARRGLYMVAALILLASGTLILSFLSHDFGLRYVAEHASRDMPWYYGIAAFYGGQEGSLLFWSLMLAIFSAIAVARHHRQYGDLVPYASVVLLIIQGFFLLLLTFVASPFTRLAFTPDDGAGLNPILRDWGMLIHPPMQLIGYMSVAIPFAFAMAALITGRLDNGWIAVSRRWILASWIFLSLGNLLGSWWAYHVLGWGGYWGWDPVENSAFMPWLAMSALLHSVMVQDKRGMLKGWNMGLIILSFGLAIFGTFVVRSGVIASVHSFALSAIGPFFFAFLALSLIGPCALLVWRFPRLKPDRPMDALVSRESSFLFNNWLLVSVALVTFWGTVFPLVSEAVTSNKVAVGKPFYEQANGPLFLGLVLLMGIGPLIPWRKATRDVLLRNLVIPVAGGGVVATILVVFGMRETAAVFAYGVCAFVVAGIGVEFYRGAQVRHRHSGESWPVALVRLTRRNPSRFGGYVVHLGIVMITVAVVSSSVYQTQKQVILKPGESTHIGPYTLTFTGLEERKDGDAVATVAPVRVRGEDGTMTLIYPQKWIYPGFENQPTTGVAIQTTLRDDVYVVFNGLGEGGAVSLYMFVNPMVIWLWIGGGLLFLGGLITWYPQFGRHRVPVVARSVAVPEVVSI